MVGLLGQQSAEERVGFGQRGVVADGAMKHRLIVANRVGRQRLIVYPYLRIADAITHQSEGHIGMAEICVHHIGHGCAVFAFTVHYYAQQLAAAFFLIAIEQLQGKEVVGGGTYIGVEDDERDAAEELVAGTPYINVSSTKYNCLKIW